MVDMCPNELDWIEFRSTSWKGVNVQTRFSFDEVLDQASLMNGMVVPNQDNRTCNALQKLMEKKNHVFTTQILSKGSDRQVHFSSTRTDQESTEQVQSLMVIQTGIGTRCLSARRPTASQWRNQ